MAAPSRVIASLWQLTADGTLRHHLWVSLGRVASGMAFAILAGGSLALIAGLSRVGEYVVDAPMQMLRTLPVLALIPLFIIWFGIGELPKVALVAVAATFPIYLTLYSGIRGVDVKLVELAKIIGLSRAGLIRHVILPAALPSALVGLRYSLGIAWLMLVAAEQVNATSGIGYLMNDARDFMRTDILALGHQAIDAHEMETPGDVHVAVVGKCHRLTERQVDLGQNCHGIHHQRDTLPAADRMSVESEVRIAGMGATVGIDSPQPVAVEFTEHRHAAGREQKFERIDRHQWKTWHAFR